MVLALPFPSSLLKLPNETNAFMLCYEISDRGAGEVSGLPSLLLEGKKWCIYALQNEASFFSAHSLCASPDCPKISGFIMTVPTNSKVFLRGF